MRIPPKINDNRYVDVGETSPGMAGIWANVHATDAAAFDKRLDALAATVCDADPRTKEQRRADACGALGRLEERLACQCGSEDCSVAAERKAVSDVVIHVLAEQATIDGTSDQPGYPFERCDVDHTAPYPAGVTHASNNKLYCRTQQRQRHVLQSRQVRAGRL